MTKKDLIVLRDRTLDQDVKKALRYAIKRIESLEKRLLEIEAMCHVVPIP